MTFLLMLLFAANEVTLNFGDIVKETAAKYELDEKLVAAVIWQESKGKAWAFNWEPGFYKRYLELRPRAMLSGYVPQGLPTVENEKRARSASYGLMQVMGETARALGYREQYLLGILEPRVNIDYGCKKLSQLMKKAKMEGLVGQEKERQALLWYNGGGDKQYPDRVFGHIDSGAYLNILVGG